MCKFVYQYRVSTQNAEYSPPKYAHDIRPSKRCPVRIIYLSTPQVACKNHEQNLVFISIDILAQKMFWGYTTRQTNRNTNDARRNTFLLVSQRILPAANRNRVEQNEPILLDFRLTGISRLLIFGLAARF